VGLAFLDTSTGDLRVTDCRDEDAAWSEIVRMEPKEIVSTAGAFERASAIPRTRADPAWFDDAAATTALCRLLAVADLTGFGVPRGSPSVGAAGALVSYAREVARVDLSHVRTLVRYETDGHLVLDEATRRNLEILRPLRGSGRKGTLLHLLDGTRTSMGARLLREWLSFPLTDVAAIDRRLDAVEAFPPGLAPQRAARRPACGRRSRSARRQGVAGNGERARPRGAAKLARSSGGDRRARRRARDPRPCLSRGSRAGRRQDVARWLVDEPPAQITEGGLVRPGAHSELDELRSLAREGKGAIAAMEARERSRTGIASLKVRYNRVFGYFLEVTHANKDKVPADWLRKQTLTGAERYITPELKEFEDKVVGADERCNEIELDLFKALRGASRPRRRGSRRWRARSRSSTSSRHSPTSPSSADTRGRVSTRHRSLDRAGRHPVVEAMGGDERFVPNDVHLDAARRLVVLTGPNMAGKSTVMRQVALIALLAQIGSFVPARKRTSASAIGSSCAWAHRTTSRTDAARSWSR
jgi:DNA mismatch repair protein MutS